MRLLLTNDDGVRAPGLRALAEAACWAGHDVIIAAPLLEASGSAAATGALRGATASRVPYERVDLGISPAPATFGLRALPALCVSLAFAGAFGDPPDLVLSGVNHGRNVGHAILHSGTIGATLCASQHGCSGLALSVQGRRKDAHFESAAALGMHLVESLSHCAPGTIFSCNVPDRPVKEILGVRRARIGTSPLVFDAVMEKSAIVFARGLPPAGLEEGTDEQLFGSGYATVTPLRGITEDTDPRTGACLKDALVKLDSIVGGATPEPSDVAPGPIG